MTYNIQAALNVEKADKNFIEAGIHENIKLDGVRAEKSQNGSNFIEFKFSNEFGSSFTHTEWESTPRPTDTQEQIDSRNNNQLSRILQLMLVYVSREELLSGVGQLNGFESMSQWVKTTLDRTNQGNKMRIKVVYNDRGFTTLPKYAKYTFIESMNVPVTDTKIKKLGIDLFDRPIVVADKESMLVTSPFAGNAVSTTGNVSTNPNGLPF